MVLKAYLGPSVNSPNNSIADALSRFHWQDFHCLTSEARPHPPPIPLQLLQDLISRQVICYSYVPVLVLLLSVRQDPLVWVACPADEWTLCLFARFLAGSLQHSSIKVYLFGMRALHIDEGFADPLHNCLRLQRVICGMQRTQGSPSSRRLPITDDLILVIWKS